MGRHGKASRERNHQKQRADRKQLTKQLKKEAKAAKRGETATPTSMARPPLAIPTVTEDDLLAFQLSHFGDDTRPDTFFVDPQQALQFEPEWQEYEDNDDGLGWYEDGVKRTLTDEQIAMFRHSEMMGLMRPSTEPADEVINGQDAADASVFARGAVDHYSPESSLEPELAGLASTPKSKSKKSKKKAKKRQSSQGSRSESTQSTTGPPIQRQRRKEEVPYDDRHKRKWEDYIEDNDPTQGSMTHRRLVRELDEQKTESFEMDY